MAKYRKVDPRIWNDEKFRLLSDKSQLVFFFVLTHPHMTALGAMRATIPGLASEKGWSEKAFREAFLEASLKGMVKHDEKACLVWLPKFLNYNKPESPNVVKAWADSLDYLPECSLKNELIQHVKGFTEGLSKAFIEALPEAFAKTMLYQEQEQEQEQEKENKGNETPKYPPELNLSAWNEYLAYRRQAKIKALKKSSEEKQTKWLVEQGGHEIQQQIVDQSIKNGWQGLFELKGVGNGTAADRRATVGEHIQREGERAAQELADSESDIHKNAGNLPA